MYDYDFDDELDAVQEATAREFGSLLAELYLRESIDGDDSDVYNQVMDRPSVPFIWDMFAQDDEDDED